MRVSGIIAVLIIAGLCVATSYFITDEVIESQIEHQMSMANGALVEIDDFKFSLISLDMSWSRLQVTDPENTMQNLFETAEADFNVQFWPLMWSKIIVDDVKLTGFQLQTERETDGYFELPTKEGTVEADSANISFFAGITREVTSNISQNAQMEFVDVKDDINVDSLMAKVDLKAIDRIDSLKNGLEANYTKWDSTISNNTITAQVTSIKTLVQNLKLEDINDVPKALAALETVKEVAARADSVRDQVVNVKENFEEDLTTSKQSIGNIDEWIQEDIRRAQNVAKLPDLNPQSIGSALFGENLLGGFSKYLDYLSVARKYGSRVVGANEKEDKPERYEGRNYAFSDKYDWPGFWLKNMELSGITNNGIALTGKVLNVTNNQNKTELPITFDLSGENLGDATLSIDGKLDYRGEERLEMVDAAYTGFSLINSKISPSELLPYELETGEGAITVGLQINNKRIDSEVKYVASNLAFDLEGAGAPKGTVERLIRTAISGTDQINATALLDNTEGPLKVVVRSNVDDLFLNTLRSTVQAEVDEAKRRIRNEVEGRVNEKKAEVENLVKEKEAELRAEYERFEQRITDELAIIEAKKEELEKKKKELEEAVKDKALDAIKKKIGF
jgi:uncharacterized protein (TIGR03545 family)